MAALGVGLIKVHRSQYFLRTWNQKIALVASFLKVTAIFNIFYNS